MLVHSTVFPSLARAIRIWAALLVAVAILPGTSNLCAQASAPQAIDYKHADAVLNAAHLQDGLENADLKPWHLKASYEIVDRKNNVTAQGIFEEWQTAGNSWRRSYNGPHYTGDEYRLPGAIASDSHVPWPESLIAKKLLDPVDEPRRDPTTFSDPTHTAQIIPPAPWTIDSFNVMPHLKLSCIHTAADKRNADQTWYCFEPQTTDIRLTTVEQLTSIYNNLAIFEGQRVNRDLTVTVNKHDVLRVHLLTLTEITPAAAANALASDKLAPRHSSPIINAYDLPGVHRLSGASLSYPRSALMRGDQGVVLIDLLIHEDGHVSDLQVVETPSLELAEAALASVKSWVYQPSQLDGQPATVSKVISVGFRWNR